MESLTIGTLAKAAQVNLQTVRYYEREGLLPEPPRKPSGYRIFSSDAVRRVRFIKRAQELGFSLKQIKELLSIRVDPASDCSHVQKLARAKVVDIEEKIRTLQGMKKVLGKLATACPGSGPLSECPILESFEPDGEIR